jgi:predicted RNA binding protein YcfA (HicA-like mRNA interferase family)
MRKVPVVSGRDLARRLEKIGFTIVRQKGTHMILRRETPPRMTVSVPDHRELKRKTLQNILRQIGLTRSELEKLG